MDCGLSLDCRPENPITVLTQGIARLLDINCPRQKVDKYIKHLQALCFGTPDDKFSKFFGFRLTQDECVDCLLSIGIVQDYCLANPREGLKIANQLLCLNKLSGIASQFLASLLPSLVNCISMQEIRPTLQSLWKQKDKSNIPVALLECMLLEMKEVESVLIKAYMEAEDTVHWEDSPLRYLVQWGSCSPFGFQTITTVLNNILIYSNNRSVSFKMVSDYIRSVKSLCSHETRDFVKLYPLEFQSLVVLLKVDPDSVKSDPSFDEFEKIIVESVTPICISNPHVALMLLSHFNQWLSVFNSSNSPPLQL